MRMPWVPSVQSRACEAGVKFVRSVTELERVGSSETEMGEKRWSSNALYIHMDSQLVWRHCPFLKISSRRVTYAVIAFIFSPTPSFCASNVPMHPRRLLFPLRDDTVFQVTNKGCSSSLGGAAGDGC